MSRLTGRRVFFIAVAALLLLAPVLTLSRHAAAQDRPVLRFGANAADLSTLDPHYASGTQDRTVVDMIFNALVRFKPGDASVIEPDLATAIPEPVTERGPQSWPFTLRACVMCP